jgi:hypothetical protein
MHALGLALLFGGATYLFVTAAWVGWLIPFSRRATARRKESYDHDRARIIRGAHLLSSILAVIVGLWLTNNH